MMMLSVLDVTRPGEEDYYKPYLYPGIVREVGPRTPEQLVVDVGQAHAQLRAQQRELERTKARIQWLWGALVFALAAFWAVMKYMMPYVVMGIVNGAR